MLRYHCFTFSPILVIGFCDEDDVGFARISEVVLPTNPNKLWFFLTLNSLLFCSIVSESTSRFWQLLHCNVIFFPCISLQMGRTPTFEISGSKECVLSLSVPTLHCSDWVKSLPWHPALSVALASNLLPNARNFHEWKKGAFYYYFGKTGMSVDM